jgi:hypothetical protein
MFLEKFPRNERNSIELTMGEMEGVEEIHERVLMLIFLFSFFFPKSLSNPFSL